MNRLDFLFFSRRDKDKYIPPHVHGCYELVYYLGGSGESSIASRSYAFRSNMFAVISPNVVHEEKHLTGGEVLFIGFHSDHEALIGLNGIFEDDSALTILHTMFQMKDEFLEQRPGYSDMLNLLAGRLIIQIQRLIDTDKLPPRSGDQLQYVRNYMDEHYRQKIAVETLAQMSGYSYDRFRHLFKEKYGEAPLQYLFAKRIEHAKMLLSETRISISDIALQSGFASDVQFCSMFKRAMGMTAKEYRNSTKWQGAS